MYYKVHISCVDGETLYVMGSKSKAALLEFLQRHDHEGSGVFLESFDSVDAFMPAGWHDGEQVYAFLREP